MFLRGVAYKLRDLREWLYGWIDYYFSYVRRAVTLAGAVLFKGKWVAVDRSIFPWNMLIDATPDDVLKLGGKGTTKVRTAKELGERVPPPPDLPGVDFEWDSYDLEYWPLGFVATEAYGHWFVYFDALRALLFPFLLLYLLVYSLTAWVEVSPSVYETARAIAEEAMMERAEEEEDWEEEELGDEDYGEDDDEDE